MILKPRSIFCGCFIFFFFWQSLAFALAEKPIVVVIPSYNNERWIQNNLTSVFSQDYENYKVIYVDDCSTDNTYKLALELVATYHQQERVTIIHNTERCGAMANWYRAIHMCNDNAIIVQLDGDDWLAHNGVLSYINKIYSEYDIWLTYGQFMEHPTGIKYYEYSKKFDEQVIKNNSFRKVEQLPMSHLRTCYAWLFKSIKLKDVLYQGNFYPMTCDKVILACCVEMAAHHHYCVPEVLYVWNNMNSISDHKVNQQLQYSLGWYVMTLPPYEQLHAPRKVDELDGLDRISLIYVCEDRPSQEILDAIAEHKIQYDKVFVLLPEDFGYLTNDPDGRVIFVPYVQAGFGQRLQYCLQQIASHYVQLSSQVKSLELDTTLCAKLLKKTQAEIMFNIATADRVIQDEKLPRVSFHYQAYAWYPKNHEIIFDGGLIWSKKYLTEIVEYDSERSLQGVKEGWQNFVQKNETLCLLFIN